ncbi:MAG: ExbD/TolR family protein [Sandaracinaceae bacterium]
MSEINVTPLVDVMLVLLIIFMVAAPLLTKGVEVDLPPANAERMGVDEETLILSIDAAGRGYLGEDPVPMESLQATLLANRRLQEENEIYVQADEAVPYGAVVRVLAIVRQAGVTGLGLITDPAGEAPSVPAEPAP